MLQMCGPTGIGFLYAKSDLLATMPPFLGELLFPEARIRAFLYWKSYLSKSSVYLYL